ncbi:hypothetical protein C2S52_008344 [Perilla frutescens var. hirtella]|nr:hypothetical protein C2S52_008344 [Perilla frutescens var. hirtella]
MSDSTPVRDHVLQMMGFLSKIETLGGELDPESQIDIVFHCLSPRFEQFRLSCNMIKKDVTLSELLIDLQAAKHLQKGSLEAHLARASSLGVKKKRYAPKKAAKGVSSPSPVNHTGFVVGTIMNFSFSDAGMHAAAIHHLRLRPSVTVQLLELPPSPEREARVAAATVKSSPRLPSSSTSSQFVSSLFHLIFGYVVYLYVLFISSLDIDVIRWPKIGQITGKRKLLQ